MPPTITNHTQCGPIIYVDREWPHFSVTDKFLVCRDMNIIILLRVNNKEKIHYRINNKEKIHL